MQKLLRFALGLAVIIALIHFTYRGGANALLLALREVALLDWLSLSLVSLLSMLLLGAAFQVSIRIVDAVLPYAQAFRYTVMNSFFNMVLPVKGGLWLRGYYLKQHFGVSWGHYLFVMFSSQLMQVALFLAVALLLVTTTDSPISVEPLYARYALIGLLVGVASILLLFRFSEKAMTGLKMWLQTPSRLIVYLVISTAFHAAAALRLWLAFSLTGTALGFLDVALLYCLLAAGLSWAITPGNIGVKEAAIVLLGNVFGIPAEQALAASIIDRIASLVVIVGIGGPASYQVTQTATPQK